jgi:ABC-type proline/glycine betaine transport system permease subunit
VTVENSQFASQNPPTMVPQEDTEQYERFVEQFVKWRTTIFDRWLSVMKTYQEMLQIFSNKIGCFQHFLLRLVSTVITFKHVSKPTFAVNHFLALFLVQKVF